MFYVIFIYLFIFFPYFFFRFPIVYRLLNFWPVPFCALDVRRRRGFVTRCEIAWGKKIRICPTAQNGRWSFHVRCTAIITHYYHIYIYIYVYRDFFLLHINCSGNSSGQIVTTFSNGKTIGRVASLYIRHYSRLTYNKNTVKRTVKMRL